MIVDSNENKPQNNLENFQINEASLRQIRNAIVGSFDYKVFYFQNGVFQQILSRYITESSNKIEPITLDLLISIIDSYIISYSSLCETLSEQIKALSSQFTSLAGLTLKMLSNVPLSRETQSLYEKSFRLLANLKQQGLFNVDQSFTNFISSIDKYLINDVLFQSICVILSKICENSYYIHLITQNEKLIEKLIDKFYSYQNKAFNININKALARVLVPLTEEDPNFITVFMNHKDNQNFINILTKGIRSFDIEVKILYIKLMMNIIVFTKLEAIKNALLEEPIVRWSLSIITDLITNKEDDDEKTKINSDLTIQQKILSVSALSNLLKFSIEFQNAFYNLQGIEMLTNEFSSLFSMDKLKEVNEKIKTLKANRAKKSDKIFLLEKEEDTIIANDIVPDLQTEYKCALIDCLANASSLKEESRKKIAEGSEIKIIIDILSDPSNPSKLLLAAAMLILSLSRGHLTIKKILLDCDITSLLFKLSSHSNVDIQIQTTNSLCNFLLDNSAQVTEVVECVSRLLKIFKATTHKKIRFNSVCAMKNIFFSVNSNREIKKNIMRKITYETLLTLLDDPDPSIKEQSLLIFRVLLYKSPEDIEEVFYNCKDQLLKKISSNLANKDNTIDIIVHSLYVLSNISSGNNKQKSVINEDFLEKIIYFSSSKVPNIRLVCMIILNNLLTSQEMQKIILGIEGIMPALEKIAFEDGNISSERKESVGSITDNSAVIEGGSEENKEAKQLAMGIIGIINNLKKEKQ